jgi:hypothetical protein
VLIDYHNSLLDQLENELNNHPNNCASTWKTLIKNLTSKEVSILQIARDNNGVITLTEDDLKRINILSRVSLVNENDEYFRTATTSLKFNFQHVQSYVIRTHMLLCRINYEHIKQKYQCHVQRKQRTTMDMDNVDLDEKYCQQISDEQLENDWSHIKSMTLYKLHHSHELLQHLTLMISSADNDLSTMNLYEYAQDPTNGDCHLYDQIQQYEINDFQLCYINHVRTLYAESTKNFQHLFTDVSHLLHAPIPKDVDEKLRDTLETNIIRAEQDSNVDVIHMNVRTITELLNELSAMEATLVDQMSQSLRETCFVLAIDNPILAIVPTEVKCENYVSFSIHLIRTRAILQEIVVNIEEKQPTLWQEHFDSQNNHMKQDNRFHTYLNTGNQIVRNENDPERSSSKKWEILSTTNTTHLTEFKGDEFLHDSNDFIDNHLLTTIDQSSFNESIVYTSLCDFDLTYVPWTTSVPLIKEQQFEEETKKAAIKFTVTHVNGDKQSCLWKQEKIFDNLRKLLTQRYNHEIYVVVDMNKIFIDFTTDNVHLSTNLYRECFIVEKSSLHRVRFHFGENSIEYLTTDSCTINDVIHRYLDEHNATSTSSNTLPLSFFDVYGKSLNDQTIGQYCQSENNDQKIINITVKDDKSTIDFLCEVRLRMKQGRTRDYNRYDDKDYIDYAYVRICCDVYFLSR